jgi:hypothetical protein
VKEFYRGKSRTVLCIVFAAMLIAPLLSIGQDADALTPVSITSTGAAITSDSTDSFKRVYHDTGATPYLRFLDSNASGQVTQDNYNISTDATSSFSNPVPSALVRQTPDLATSSSDESGFLSIDNDAETFWRTGWTGETPPSEAVGVTSQYRFNGNGNDSVGANTLTANGTPTYSSVDQYINGQYTVLNGSSQYFTAASNTVFDVTTQDFSMYGMFYRTTDTGAGEVIVDKRSSSGLNAGYDIEIDSFDRLVAQVSDGATLVAITLNTPTVTTNNWYIFVFSATRAGNGVLYLYNVGTGEFASQTTSISGASGSLTNTSIFTVARLSFASANFFPGYVDNITFINNNAVSATNALKVIAAYVQGSGEASAMQPVTPTSQYRFFGNGNDSVGSNTLTATGSPTYSSAKPNIFGQYVTLNGSTQYFQAASGAVFNVTTSDFSLAGYFYRTADSGGTEYLLNKRTGVTTQAGYNIYINGGDQLEASLSDGGTRILTTLSTPTITLNTWYFYAASFDRDGNATVYLYNLSTGSMSSTSASIAAQQGSLSNPLLFTVGRQTNAASSFFAGRLDHVIVFETTALSASQVGAMAQAYLYGDMGAPQTVSEVNLYMGDQMQVPPKIDVFVSNSTSFSEASRKTFTMPTYLQSGYWNFNSNPLDSSGNANALTPFATPTYVAGRFNNAVSLNGSTQYLQASSSSVLDITTGDFTLSGYFYRTSDTGAAEIILGKKVNGGAGYRVEINSSDRLNIEISSASSVQISPTPTISTNTWYFWAYSASRGGNGVAYLYNLGTGETSTATNSITSQSASMTNAQTFTVGRNSHAASGFFPGYLDELRFHSRALTQPEIQNLMLNPSRFYDLTLDTPVVGRYVKVQVNLWNPLYSWTTNEYDVTVRGTASSDVYVSDIETTNSYWSTGRDSTYNTNVLNGRTLYTDNLAGWYEFENTPNDSSGNGNTATLNNGVKYATGKFGNGAVLDGLDDYVSIPNTANTDNLDQFTFSLWMYPTVSATSGNRHIVDKGWNNNGGFVLYLVSGNTSIELDVRNNSGTGVGSTCVSCIPSLNTWYHVVGVYDGSNVRVHVNGVAGNPSNPLTGTLSLNQPIRLGQSSNDFGGMIDDFRIYKNRAFTSTEITNLYNSNVDPAYLYSNLYPMGAAQSTSRLYLPLLDPTGDGTLKLGAIPKMYGSLDEYDALSGWWKFDEGSGSVAIDSSGLGNNGTISGATFADGIRNGALSFDGTNDSVTVPYSQTLDSLGQLSVAFWMYPTSYGGGNLRHIIEKGWTTSPNTAGEFVIYLDNAVNDRIWGCIRDPALTVRCSSNTSIDSLNMWYHVSFVYDGATVKLYVNDVAPATTASATGVLTNSDAIIMGGATTDFAGRLDDARIYQNKALTDGERDALYYGEYPLYTGTPSVPVEDEPMHSVVVNDGASEAVYAFFASNSTTVRAVKFATATQTATLLSTTMSSDDGGTNDGFQVLPASGKIHIIVGSHVYELNTSTDVITQVLTETHVHDNPFIPEDVDDWITWAPQPFTVSTSARSYVDTNLLYFASPWEGHAITPSTGALADYPVFVEDVERGTDLGTVTIYSPRSFYFFSGLSLLVDTADGTSWTIRDKGAGVNITNNAHHEFLQSVEPDPFGPYEQVHFIYCGAMNFNMNSPMYQVAEYDDCTEWHTFSEEDDPTAEPYPRKLFPFTATAMPVHGFDYSLYTIQVTISDPQDYYLKAKFNDIVVDMERFDASGVALMRLLEGNCYDLEYIRASDDFVKLNVYTCANGDFIKESLLFDVLGFLFYTAPWGIAHEWDDASNILNTIVRHEDFPYNYNVQLYNTTSHLLSNSTFTSSTEMDTRTFNMTSYAGEPFKVIVLDDDGKTRYSAWFGEGGGWAANIKTMFDEIQFNGWGILLFLPLIFAAMFTRDTAGIGGAMTVVFVGALTFMGFIAIDPIVIVFLTVAAVVGLLAYRQIFG